MRYDTLLERYRDGSITPGELDELRRALRRCETCDEILAGMDEDPPRSRGRSLLRDARSGPLVPVALAIVLVMGTGLRAWAPAGAAAPARPAASGRSAVVDHGFTLVSGYLSDDVPGGTDGVSRLNLQSYQRAHTHAYGETIRHFLMRGDAKAMEAYYVPRAGYDDDGSARARLNADGTVADLQEWRPVSWTGAHWGANDGGADHGHWSVEVPDTTGRLQTRLEVGFRDPRRGTVGVARSLIQTSLADLVVRTRNGQVLRLAAPAGNAMPIEFNHSGDGDPRLRRWRLGADDGAERGRDAGTDFQLLRYGDDGRFLGPALHVDRATGTIVLGSATPTRGVALDVGGDAIRLRTPRTVPASSSPGAAGQISWDEHYLYVCVAENTWARVPLLAW